MSTLPALLPRSPPLASELQTGPALPRLVAAAGEAASLRFLEFFAASIRNPHTRRAYARAVVEFLAWCEGGGESPRLPPSSRSTSPPTSRR